MRTSVAISCADAGSMIYAATYLAACPALLIRRPIEALLMEVSQMQQELEPLNPHLSGAACL